MKNQDLKTVLHKKGPFSNMIRKYATHDKRQRLETPIEAGEASTSPLPNQFIVKLTIGKLISSSSNTPTV